MNPYVYPRGQVADYDDLHERCRIDLPLGSFPSPAYGNKDFRENVVSLLCKKKNEKVFLGKVRYGSAIQQLFHICK